jgi:hypothetical protein
LAVKKRPEKERFYRIVVQRGDAATKSNNGAALKSKILNPKSKWNPKSQIQSVHFEMAYRWFRGLRDSNKPSGTNASQLLALKRVRKIAA